MKEDAIDEPNRDNYRTAAAAEAKEGARSLLKFMGDIAGGELEIEGSRELHDLAKILDSEARYRNSTVKGGLTITIKFSTDETGTTDVTYDVKSKTPTRKTTRSTFWMTKGGNLSVTNPKQLGLALREVPNPKRGARSVDNDERPAREAT